LAKFREEVERERKKKTLAKFREEVERERKEKENTIRRMKQNEEQNEREIAELRDKLSRAASLTSQVNIFHEIIHSSSLSFPFHSVMLYSIHFARLLVI